MGRTTRGAIIVLLHSSTRTCVSGPLLRARSAVVRNANNSLVLTSRDGNRLRSSVIRVWYRLRPHDLVRANGVALLEVSRQLEIGQVIPVLCLCEQLPFVHAVVRGLLAAQRTHRTQASHFLHCEPPFAPACLQAHLCCHSFFVVTLSQIEFTSDSPVFDGQSMIAQSSDFSPDVSSCSPESNVAFSAPPPHFRTEILIVSGLPGIVVSLRSDRAGQGFIPKLFWPGTLDCKTAFGRSFLIAAIERGRGWITPGRQAKVASVAEPITTMAPTIARRGHSRSSGVGTSAVPADR